MLPIIVGGTLQTAWQRLVRRRLTPRASHGTRKGYVVFFWHDQALVSAVFARKLR